MNEREAFESSEHYFCGESPADRIVNWAVWKSAWQAALAHANVNEQSQAHQTESQWISVEERLPEENCHVLVACEGGNVATTFYATDHSFFNHAHGYKLSRKVHGKYSEHFELARQYGYKITHWMPLPPAPMNEVNKPEGEKE